MGIHSLSRLSDEDREALDLGYVSIPGATVDEESVQPSRAPATFTEPLAILLGIAAAVIFFLCVALSRFDDRLAAVEAKVGIEPPPAIVEDFR